MDISSYFDIRELVCPHTHRKFGESSWRFLDDRLLDTLLFIREALGKPIAVNNWHVGGNFQQRGLRCNVCSLVSRNTRIEKVYLSAHVQGKGIDFDVSGMSADEVRQWIDDNQSLLPYPIRLERDVNWVHLDMRNDGSKAKVTYFNG